MLSLTLIITSALVFMLGALVLANDRSNRRNITFFALSSATTLWVLANFFVIALPDNLFIQRTITPTSAAIALALLYFLDTYSHTSYRFASLSISLKIYSVLFSLILALSFTDLNVYRHNDSFGFGGLYYFYVAYMALGIMYTIKKLISLNHAKGQKHNNQILSFALLAFILPSVLTGIVMPIFGADQLLDATPIFTLFFFAITTYGVLNNGLFDIRAVIWRLVTYVVTLLIITLILLAGAQNILFRFLATDSLGLNVQLYYIATSLAMIALFQPLKRVVDRVTNRFFLQAPYSIHGTINKISTYSTSNNERGVIEKEVLNVIAETLKPAYIALIRHNSANSNAALGFATNTYPNHLRADNHMKILLNAPEKIVSKDSIRSQKLRDVFETGDIGIIVKVYTHSKLIGCLVLGNKTSGSPFFSKDKQLLTLAADNLALALQNAQRYEEIQAFNETLQNKVADATKALRRTNKKLIALDDAKDEFISMASHQLRTPLTSVKGYISMLLEEDLGKINDKQRQALKEAFDSSQRMVFLISDFLSVSRMRTGRFMIDKSPTNLKEIVTEEVAQLKEMAALREQKIIFKTPKDFPTIMIDDNKIRQVMMNMLDNAIFYTPRGGKITVKLEATDEEVSYQVVDEGIGVPEADQHRLFTKFFRAPNAQRARPDGTGLGLFMAQKIITAQGGSVIFHSVEGKGSTFGFRFALEAVALPIDK